MKKILLPLLIAAPFLGQAQDNSVKLTLSPAMVLTNNFGINYERKLTDAFSANLRVNLSSKKAVPFNGIATNMLGDLLDSNGVNSDVFNTKVVSYGASFQFRYFPKKEALNGFYLAPYFGLQAGKMQPFSFDFPDSNDPTIKHGGEVNANFLFLGAGLGIGNQWVLGNGLTIDIMWLGIGGGKNKITLDGSNSTGTVNYADIAADVNQFFTDEAETFDQLGVSATTSSSSNNIEIIAKHAFPYMKILNFSIGYSF